MRREVRSGSPGSSLITDTTCSKPLWVWIIHVSPLVGASRDHDDVDKYTGH